MQILGWFRMIKYTGNKTLVATKLSILNEIFSKYDDVEIVVSRKWVDKWNAALSLTTPSQSLTVSVEKAETKVNEPAATEEVIPYNTIN